MALQEKGDPKAALAELFKMNPKSEEFRAATRSMLPLYIKAGLVDEGIRRTEGLIATDGKNTDLYMLLSGLYEEKTDYGRSIAALENAKAIEPANIELLYQLGMLFEKKGDNSTAMKYMEEILALEPDNAGALNFIGYSYAEKGINLDKAEAMIRKALEKRPEDGYIRDSLGWVFYSKGEYQKALAEILKAQELVADDPVIAEHLADTYGKLGQYDRAVDSLHKSIRLEKKEERKKLLEEKLKIFEKQRQ
jgi:Flp pilus assembly protein TadD